MTGVYRPPVEEWQQELHVPVFAPRLRATPIPEEDWNTGLVRCFHISDAWIPHILGVLEALDQPDTWIGTDEEIEAARQNVREIMVEFGRGGECEEVPANYVVQIGDCTEDGLLVTQVTDGIESSNRIDIAACIPQITDYVKRIIECDLGVIEYEEVVSGSLEINSIDLNECLDGRFVKPSELPEPAITPVPSIVGVNLWFDTDGNGTPDLNVGRVVGYDGSDGTDAPIPAWELIGGDLYVDTNADGIYDQNLGRVVGEDGEDGICETCDQVPAPEIEDDITEGLQCSIAINEAAYLRRLWDKAYADTDGIIQGFVGGLVTGASVIAYFYPGAAVVAAIGGFMLTLFKGINDLEANVFDDDLEEWARCTLYCVLKDQNKVNIDQDVIDAWATDFAVGLDAYQLFARDLILYTPLTEFQWTAYASSEIDEAACAECDCGDEECEGGTFTVMANNSVLGETSFITNAANWYTVEWTGTAITQTTSPVQTFDGFYFTTNGSTWTLGQARMQYRKNGSYTSFPVPARSTTQHYSFVFKGDGVEKISLRLADGSYGNNSGSWTITVTCHTTNPGGTVIQL